jgi:hypothetical protein
MLGVFIDQIYNHDRLGCVSEVVRGRRRGTLFPRGEGSKERPVQQIRFIHQSKDRAEDALHLLKEVMFYPGDTKANVTLLVKSINERIGLEELLQTSIVLK